MKLIKSILLGLTWILIFYITFSFYKLSFNVIYWNPEDRFLLILLGLPFGVLISVLQFFNSENK